MSSIPSFRRAPRYTTEQIIDALEAEIDMLQRKVEDVRTLQGGAVNLEEALHTAEMIARRVELLDVLRVRQAREVYEAELKLA
jgi:cob(I)alamin adenosyltransferase